MSTAVSVFCNNSMHQMSTTTKDITVNNTHRTVVNNVSMKGAHVLTHTHTHTHTVIINKSSYSFQTVCLKSGSLEHFGKHEINS